MVHIVLLCMSALLLALAIHPFITYELTLNIMRHFKVKCPARPVAGGATPVLSFAVCVPAHNEEKVIAAKIENLLALRRATPRPVEILIYVDAATDRTAAIVRGYGDQVRLVEGRERRGKTAGMNRLAAMTEADILVFSDANVMVEPDALVRLASHFTDPTIGCICGSLVYVNAADSATAGIGAEYWRREERLKQLESDTGGVIGADGSLFAIRRSLHRPVPDDIIDDFFLSLAVLCDGHRVVRGGDVRAAEQATTISADEFRRKVRIACQAFNVHRLLRPRLASLHWTLRYKYLSHKLLRWLSLANAAVAAALAIAGVAAGWGWWTVLPVAALGALVVAVLLSLPPTREIMLALAATTLGLVRSLAGERFQTWTPPLSRDSRAEP